MVFEILTAASVHLLLGNLELPQSHRKFLRGGKNKGMSHLECLAMKEPITFLCTIL